MDMESSDSAASERAAMTASEACALGIICGHCYRTFPSDGVCVCGRRRPEAEDGVEALAAPSEALGGDAPAAESGEDAQQLARAGVPGAAHEAGQEAQSDGTEPPEERGMEGAPASRLPFGIIPKEFRKCKQEPQWKCPQCEQSNWRTRLICKQCGANHPEHARHLSELVGEAVRRAEHRAEQGHGHSQASSSHEGERTQWTRQEWKSWEKNRSRNERRGRAWARHAFAGWQTPR